MSNEIEVRQQTMVVKLAKDGQELINQMTPLKMHLQHMAIGVSGEAGELVDAIKKGTIYNRELDIENIIEELGDLEFYMEGVRGALGLTREQTLEANIAKLSKRYPDDSYTDKHAEARLDKQS